MADPTADRELLNEVLEGAQAMAVLAADEEVFRAVVDAFRAEDGNRWRSSSTATSWPNAAKSCATGSAARKRFCSASSSPGRRRPKTRRFRTCASSQSSSRS